MRNNVPTIEIDGPEWTVDHLFSVDDCDKATVALTRHITTIEQHLSDPERTVNVDWSRKARAALRLKKLGLQIVARKRGDLRRQTGTTWERTFVDTIRNDYPHIFKEVTSRTP